MKILDESLKADFELLAQICDGEVEITSQTLDQSQWLVAFATDDGPVKYFRYQRHTKQADYLLQPSPGTGQSEIGEDEERSH